MAVASRNSREMILDRLQTGEWVNNTDLFKITPKITSRISELRSMGHNIECKVTNRRRRNGGAIYAYRLLSGEAVVHTYARLPLDRGLFLQFAKEIARQQYGKLTTPQARTYLNRVRSMTDTDLRKLFKSTEVMLPLYSIAADTVMAEHQAQ